MIIEQATIDDTQEILILQKLAYQSEAKIYNDFNISPLIQTLEEIKDEFKDKYFLKAVVNGKIIGSVRAFVKGETCYIGRLIVHPDFQNQGTGTKLIEKIEILSNNVKRFELFTGHKSKTNIYLDQKLGYRLFRTEKITENSCKENKNKLLLNSGLNKRFAGKRYLVLITIMNFENIEPFKIDRSNYGNMDDWLPVENIDKVKV